MLDKAFKKRWTRALRSGKYRQARGRLGFPKENSYCCLGVACLVAGAEQVRWRNGFPPMRIRNLIGLDMGPMKTLAHMNDGRRRGFRTIADWIEKNL